jgi:hypothetical protein
VASDLERLSGLAEEPEVDLGPASVRHADTNWRQCSQLSRNRQRATQLTPASPTMIRDYLKIITKDNSHLGGELSAAGLKYRRVIIGQDRNAYACVICRMAVARISDAKLAAAKAARLTGI